MKSLTPEEKETIIRYDKVSDMASVYSSDSTMVSWLRKRFKVVVEGCYGAEFEVPKKFIKIATPRKRVSKPKCREKTE